MTSDDKIYRAAAFAIGRAKREARSEVTRDDLLAGVLAAMSRFGVVTLGQWVIDLEELGLNWREPAPERARGPRYTPEAAEIFDKAAAIARSEGLPISVAHLLVAFDGVEDGLMGTLKTRYGFDSASWRAALALVACNSGQPSSPGRAEGNSTGSRSVLAHKEFLSPEESAEQLGVHTQTIRGYIRSGKLPALRVAGERAIRIRREDLLNLLEPLVPDEDT